MARDYAFPDLNRRRFCVVGTSAAIALLTGCRRQSVAAQGKPPVGAAADVAIVEFSNDGARGQTSTLATLVKSEAEWKSQLAPLAFDVTRHEGTERPFTSPLLNEHGNGVFRCVCCDTAVFGSDAKFESGTGWPSFWRPIAKENVSETMDSSLFMVRTAVSCRLCDAHLGHVFDDGPQPTGLRYCINGAALTFAKA